MDGDVSLWLEIDYLQHRYVNTIDNDDLEKWPTYFTEDGVYRIVSKENFERGLPAPIMYCRNQKMMRDRVVALRYANIYEPHRYRHALGGLVINDVNGDEVKTTTSYIVVNTGLAGDSIVYQTGVYLDTVVKENGSWRYKDKRVVYDTSRVQTLLATPI
jgi:anthranilate 1,2-dioxygenase small subunit